MARIGALVPFLAVLALLPHGSAFLPASRYNSNKRPLLLASTPQEFDQGGSGSWKLANDFGLFLNQVSLQSFCTVVSTLRDPQTIHWLDNFTQPVIPRSRRSQQLTGTTAATNAITSDEQIANPDGKAYSKLLTYHGLGAINSTMFPTWDSYFSTLLEQPQETFIVQSSGIKVQDYELDINPASLCTRLISVREQIAREMAHDLKIAANMGNHTMNSYWEYLDDRIDEDEEKEEEEKEQPEQFTEIGAPDSDFDSQPMDAPMFSEYEELGTEEQEQTKKFTEIGPSNDDTTDDMPPIGDFANPKDVIPPIPPIEPPPKKDEVTMSSGVNYARRLTPHNLLFLDHSIDAEGDLMFSPLRKGNFDLAVLLATQEAIHRILNNDEQTQEAGADFAIYQKYLLDFYAERMVSHFLGIQRYGRADDFLEELLFSSPRVSTEGGFAALVDPVKVAEMVLHERRQVALEWAARAEDVPNAHIAIKRLQLDALMQSYQ